MPRLNIIICRRQMKEALAKLEKEVQELHKEEQTKLEEEKKKALDRLQRLVRTCLKCSFDNSLISFLHFHTLRKHTMVAIYDKFSLGNMNIGITHVFSCINICRVPRKLLER